MRKQLFFPLLLFFQMASIFAHESRPLLIKIIETKENFSFNLNLPNTVDQRNSPIVYINDIAINQNQQWRILTGSYRQQWQLPKEELALKGAVVKIAYPSFNPVLSTIIIIHYLEEEEQILVVPPTETMLTIPEEANAVAIRKQYNILGIEHIWAGIDHLLFLVCLVIITGFSRKLFITITGFTIAHSITLILSALKIIQLAIPPIEATIALSIVFLCYEIIHHHQDKNSLTYRYPIVVASSFGLLHGLGFAAVLGEIGLPPKHTLEALLFFNIGVEIGQVLFIIALFLVALVFDKMIKRFVKETSWEQVLAVGLQIATYFVGILAAYWMFDRIH